MSLSVLLLNNGAESIDIKALLISKIPTCSITFRSLTKITDSKKLFSILSEKKYDFCICKDQGIIGLLSAQISSIICWQDIPDLSSQLDTFIQLHRYRKKYPLYLKDWELMEVLHNSQDCIIYKGKNVEGCNVAIKRFKFDSSELSRRTIHEYIQWLDKQTMLRSTGLIHFFDGGICNHAFYLVMEYLSYGTLRQYLNAHDNVISLEHALIWFKEIAVALNVVHQSGLIHRDLKIDNIMLRKDGSLALIDYGVSKQILLDARFLNENEFHGSPYYLSPELIAGEACSQSSDIYSLGVILYELLTGTKPYAPDNSHDLMVQHVICPIPTLDNSLAIFQSIINNTLAKNTEERFATVAELILEIKRVERSLDLDELSKKAPSYFFHEL